MIIDDEAVLAKQIGAVLQDAGHDVRIEGSLGSGRRSIVEHGADLVLLDVRLPDGSGLDLLESIHDIDPTIPVLLMTAYGSVPDVVHAMRGGAADYLQKPLDLDELVLTVERLLQRERETRELTYHRTRDHSDSARVVGAHPDVLRILEQVDRLGEASLPPGSRPPILLTGETGTGKGRLARAIHERLGTGPFLEVNCTAMPETLIEAELFGHERGTFTDAKTSRTGLFEAAAGGTLFLDEIGHAGPELQAKLLKVIEDKRVRRLGSNHDVEVDVHVIAASNRDLDAAVEAGEFRADLLYRLQVLAFVVPSLRERSSDIPLLIDYFVAELGRLYGRRVKVAPEAVRELRHYPWPGNVRELRNVLERAVLLSAGDELDARAFSGILQRESESEATGAVYVLPEQGVQLAELEQDLIRQALERSGGNRQRAAVLLGLTRHTLRYRLEKFGLGD